MPKGGQGAKHQTNKKKKRSHAVQTLTFVPQKAGESQRKCCQPPEKQTKQSWFI